MVSQVSPSQVVKCAGLETVGRIKEGPEAVVMLGMQTVMAPGSREAHVFVALPCPSTGRRTE